MPGIVQDELVMHPGQQPGSAQIGLKGPFVKLPTGAAASAISNVATPIVLPPQPEIGELIMWNYYDANRREEEQIAPSLHTEWKLDSYSGRREELLNALGDAWEEYRNGNWDGYGAIQVSEETFSHARRFVEVLPRNIPNPTIGAGPDGNLIFEWYRSPRRVLSVSISPDGDLHYAALRESISSAAGVSPRLSKSYGTEPFSGAIPEPVLTLVSQVMGA